MGTKSAQKRAEAVLDFIGEAQNDNLITSDQVSVLQDYYAGAFAHELQDIKNGLPSRYKHGEKVRHILIDENKVHSAKITKIHFAESTVTYDIELKCYWPKATTPGQPGFEVKEGQEPDYYYQRMYNIPSAYLIPVNE